MNKRIFNWMLMAALVVGLGMTVTACSDDDDDDKDGRSAEEIAQDPYEKESEAADALYRLVSQLSVCDSLPNDWKTATFEPKVGKVLDQSQPRVRTIAVNNAAEAVARYNSLTGKEVPATTTSDTYKVEGVGTLQFNVGGAGTIATIDVDVKQMPQLAQLRFVTAASIGENGHFNGTPYYTFGDVVKDKDGCYWICVRPAYSPNGKEDTHWMSFQSTDANIKTWTKSGYNKAVYPVDLGVQKEKMHYFAQLMAILANGDKYKQAAKNGNYFNGTGLGGLQEEAMPVDSLVMQAKLWMQNKIWEKIMPVGIEKDNVEFFRINFRSNLHFIYEKGSVSGKKLTLKLVKYTNSDKFYTEDPEYSIAVVDLKERAFDITNSFTTQGTNGNEYLNYIPSSFVVRYKTGFQLSSNWMFNPSPTDSIPGVTTVHRFKAIDKSNVGAFTKEQAQPGMILASNGKFYKSAAACAADYEQPVALVVYVGDNAEVNGNVAYRGLAMSYNYKESLKWDESDQREAECIENTYMQWHTWDKQNNGIERTKKLVEDGHDHPAAKAAWNFSHWLFDPEVNGCSHWFLPTAGQVLLAIKGLGGNPVFDMMGSDGWTSRIPDTWNYAGIATEDFDIKIDFWTSTEYDTGKAVFFDMHPDESGFIYPKSVSKTSLHPVRPFLAF